MVTARLGQLELPPLSDVRCVLNACEGECSFRLPIFPMSVVTAAMAFVAFAPRGGCVAAYHSCDAHLMKLPLPEKSAAVGGLAQHGIHEHRKS